MAKLNWDKVQAEALGRRRGYEQMETGPFCGPIAHRVQKEEGRVEDAPTTSQEDLTSVSLVEKEQSGSVEEPSTNQGPTMSKNIVNLKGREFNLETQGAEFLAKAFGITLYQARFVLAGVGVDYLEQVVSSLRESWKRIKKETNKTAYLRGIVEKVAAVNPQDVQTAIEPAKPTRPTPPPIPPGPLPLQPAAAPSKPPTGIETNDGNRARRDRILDKAFSEMGRGEVAEDKYTMMDFSRYFDVGVEVLRKVRAHLDDMRLRGLVRFVGDGVYAAVPECLRPPVPQDGDELE